MADNGGRFMSDKIMPMTEAVEGYDLFDKMKVQKGERCGKDVDKPVANVRQSCLKRRSKHYAGGGNSVLGCWHALKLECTSLIVDLSIGSEPLFFSQCASETLKLPLSPRAMDG